MHSLKDTQFWLCYFLFIVPMLKNDLKLCVNHQFIAPSLYNQITQLIFITDIFRPKIKCTTLFGGTLCLCKTFDRSRNGCQVIRLGAGNDFCEPSGQALPLPSRVSFSCARFFLCPTSQRLLRRLHFPRIDLWNLDEYSSTSFWQRLPTKF